MTNTRSAVASGLPSAHDSRPAVKATCRQIRAFREVWGDGVADDTADLLSKAQDAMVADALHKPSADLEDLLAKAELWRSLIDEAYGMPAHEMADAWPTFVADIVRLKS